MTPFTRHAGGGWVDPAKLPRGPNGRALCRWCKAEVPKGRQTFCKQACVDEHLCRSSATGAAQVLERRDRGVCALCLLDCKALRDRARLAWRLRGIDGFVAELVAAGWPPAKARQDHGKRRLWDADHTVPVAEGGGLCGPGGFRTLCRPCHLRATAELRSRLAAKRAEAP